MESENQLVGVIHSILGKYLSTLIENSVQLLHHLKRIVRAFTCIATFYKLSVAYVLNVGKKYVF